MLHVSRLWVYPVKSLGGVSVDEVAITRAGSFALDREWLVTDPDGHMVWQGELPRMALLSVALCDASLPGGGALRIAGPNGDGVSVPLDHDGAPVVATQYGQVFASTDAGPDAAAFLSDALERPVRLVRVGAAAHGWTGHNPVHAFTDASLNALNARLLADGTGPMAIRRFRPNVLLGGADVPFAEEVWPRIDFGSAALVRREPSTRCVLPCIDPDTAAVQREPMRMVARMSRERTTAKKGSFGIYAHAQGARLAVGMKAWTRDTVGTG